MDFDIPTIVAFILAWFGVSGGVWLCFEKTDENLTTERRGRIAHWIKNPEQLPIAEKWPDHCAHLFDKVFGEKHRSFKCFRRSCYASSIFSFLLFLLWSNYHPSALSFYISHFLSSAIGAIGVLIFFNLIPDYFSLLETRYILQRMIKAKSSIRLAAYIVVDLIITFVIWIIGYTAVVAVGNFIDINSLVAPYVTPTFNILFEPVSDVLETANSALIIFCERGKYPGTHVSIWLYTTFLTSLLIWAYVIGGVILRLIIKLGETTRLFQNIFDIDNKPLRSIGLVVVGMVTVFFLALPVARPFFRLFFSVIDKILTA